MSETSEDRLNDLVIKWLYRTGAIDSDVESITNVCIMREDSYENDSGTSWPSETVVCYYAHKTGKDGRKLKYSKSTYAPADIGQFLTELLDY